MKEPSESQNNDIFSHSRGGAENEGDKLNNGFASDDVQETLLSDVGERSEVERDSRSVRDDSEDYIFTRHRKRKVKSSGKVETTHSRHRRKKKMKTWKKTLLIIGATFLSLILLFVGSAAFLLYNGQKALFDDNIHIISSDTVPAEVQDGGDFIKYNGHLYKYNPNVTSMLFMGVDTENLGDDYGEAGGKGQADVISVVAIDTKARKCTLVNVPRDTIAEVSVYSAGGTYTGMVKQQICLSYAYGDGKETSCENTLFSVERIFYNIPINTYYALDLKGIAAMNDAVGGVDVVSPETIGEFEKDKSYHLEGDMAERFVRSREHETADANILRMQRQQVYAKEYLNKLISATKSDLSVPLNLFNASAPYSCTNLDPSRVTYLAKEAVMGSGMSFEFKSMEGKSSLDENGYAVFTPDETKFFEDFLSIYYTLEQ